MLLDSLASRCRRHRAEQCDVEDPTGAHQTQLRGRRLPPDDHANGELGRSSNLPDPIPAPTRAFTSNSAKNFWPTDSPTEAEAEFRHAAAVDPSSTAPLTALAEDYDARGDAREARAQAEAALRIRESAEAYLVLARLDLRENRMEAAAQNIDSGAATRARQFRRPGSEAHLSSQARGESAAAATTMKPQLSALSSQLSEMFVEGRAFVWGRAPSPVQAERSSATACGHSNSGFAMRHCCLRALLSPPSAPPTS